MLPAIIAGQGAGGLTVSWDSARKLANITLSNSDLDALNNGANGAETFYTNVASSDVLSSKRVIAIKWLATGAPFARNSAVGIIPTAYTLTTSSPSPGEIADGFGWQRTGVIFVNGVNTHGADAAREHGTLNDICMMGFDRATGETWIGRNGTWIGDPGAGTGEIATLGNLGTDRAPALMLRGGEEMMSIVAWPYALPSGFSDWAAS
jgi:hypothetical protein